MELEILDFGLPRELVARAVRGVWRMRNGVVAEKMRGRMRASELCCKLSKRRMSTSIKFELDKGVIKGKVLDLSDSTPCILYILQKCTGI